jgi:Asp-tRNA(Asn)/Glu-tRNA(Gln) amidotransferase A subunit family amidase
VPAWLSDEFASAGSTSLAELVRAKEVKPRELLELSLRRIEALDPQLNAFPRIDE